jgi:hypothetical protein
MKMTKNQLKMAVKAVVRECLNERIIKEVAPPGDKAERMVMHVKSSLKKSHPDWDADKIASVAIATAWKAHNKGSVEQDECGGMEEGADSKVTVIDDIVRFVLRKVPAIKGNPDKVARVAALLFHHQFGRVADGQAVMDAVERNLGYEDQVADTPVSKTPEKPQVAPAEEGGSEEEEEGKSEEEECGTMDQEEEESKSEEEETVNESKKWIQKAVNPKHKGYCTPMTKSTCTPRRKALAKRFKSGDIHQDNVDESTETLPPNKGQYKVVAQPSTDEEEENKALTIQSDPEVNENANTLPPNKGQYKTVAPHQYTTTDQNKPLTIQSDPKVNEGPIKMANLVREKNWIQGAVKHPGRCAHMGSPQCPEGSPQYNLAKRFKKGDIHKANVGEAGLTSEMPAPEMGATEPPTGMPPMGGEPEGEHDYDEREEIKLIKVVAKAAERLEAMHAGMPGDEEEPEIPIKKEFPSKPLDDAEPKKPSDGGEKKPAPKGKGSEGDKKDKKKDKKADEAKVQVRSYMTANDLPQDPKNVRDPEVPMTEGSKKK